MHSHVHTSACLDLHAHSRVDPTRTTTLRSRYERDLIRRFRKVQIAMRSHLESDTFRLFTNATKAQKIADFMTWLQEMNDRDVLEVIKGTGKSTAAANSWQNIYLKATYKKGMQSAANNVKGAGAKVSDFWLEAAFRRPFHADPVGIIYTKAYSNLKGITDVMDQQISRTLAESMAQGLGAQAASKKLLGVVDTIGVNRSRVLARTSIIDAYSEATLNTYQEARVEGVSAKSEFSSINDNVRCPECADLEGKVYSIEDARGVIPVHPNCRCSWLPYIEDATGVELR